MADFLPIWALGLMTGTSMDGVDTALLKTDGERIDAFGPAAEHEIAKGAYLRVREIVDAGRAFWNDVDPVELADAEAEVIAAHLGPIASALAGWPAPVDVIGFHGQTVFHAPDEGWTRQLGDGGEIARVFRRETVWDFRSADMVAGGQGAPLAPFYHFALARWLGAKEPVAFLNLGGVGNVTWVDPRFSAPEEEGALIAFDTGPANALVDDWVSARAGAAFDIGGALAARGRVHSDALRLNSAEEYFARPAPKSLDRNTFALTLDRISHLSTEDGAATLTALTAAGVARSVEHLPSAPSQWIVCGGGARNDTMMSMLRDQLPGKVVPASVMGIDGDALEAQAFAFLAVRAMRGLPLSAPGTTGCAQPVTGGQISLPPASG